MQFEAVQLANFGRKLTGSQHACRDLKYLDVTVKKAKELGFRKLHLFAFDPAITDYYQRFGWKKIGIDEFKSYRVTVMEMSTM